MLAGIGTVGNVNQDNPRSVQDQAKGPHKTTQDVVDGKVNPVESHDNLPDKSDLNDKTHSRDIINQGSDEEHIIDIMG